MVEKDPHLVPDHLIFFIAAKAARYMWADVRNYYTIALQQIKYQGRGWADDLSEITENHLHPPPLHSSHTSKALLTRVAQVPRASVLVLFLRHPAMIGMRSHVPEPSVNSIIGVRGVIVMITLPVHAFLSFQFVTRHHHRHDYSKFHPVVPHGHIRFST